MEKSFLSRWSRTKAQQSSVRETVTPETVTPEAQSAVEAAATSVPEEKEERTKTESSSQASEADFALQENSAEEQDPVQILSRRLDEALSSQAMQTNSLAGSPEKPSNYGGNGRMNTDAVVAMGARDIEGSNDMEGSGDVDHSHQTTDATDTAILTDEDMPGIETLDGDSDVSGFFGEGVSKDLRQQALRKLFMSPKFNIRDGLNDYDEDYTYFEPLGDTITSDMKFHAARKERERLERERLEAEELANRDQENPVPDDSQAQDKEHSEQSGAEPETAQLETSETLEPERTLTESSDESTVEPASEHDPATLEETDTHETTTEEVPPA